MGGIISSIWREPETQKLQLDNEIPFRFFDLPAELRGLTYDQILPEQTSICLDLEIHPRKLVPGQE